MAKGCSGDYGDYEYEESGETVGLKEAGVDVWCGKEVGGEGDLHDHEEAHKCATEGQIAVDDLRSTEQERGDKVAYKNCIEHREYGGLWGSIVSL